MLKASSNLQREEEVDFITLIIDLWAQKVLIGGVAAVVAISVCIYVYLSTLTPVYESKVYLLPPTQSSIAGFNSGRDQDDPDLKPLTVKGIYAAFTRTVESEAFRQKFFKEVYLPSGLHDNDKTSVDKSYGVFSQQLDVSADKGDVKRYIVSFRGPNSESSIFWAKRFVEQATESAKSELIFNSKQEISVRLYDLGKKISSLREVAQKSREDRVAQLAEALSTAEAIGLNSPQLLPNTLIAISGFTDDRLAYQRGSKALKAEIETLRARQSDDAFIPGLRELQAKYDDLSKVTTDRERISVNRQDGDIATSNVQKTAKNAIIVLGGVLFGLLLGLFIALIRVFVLRNSRGGGV